MTRVWPLTNVPASDARKTAAPPISSGSPILLRGQVAVDCLRISGFSHSALAKCVLNNHGAMALVLTFCGPNSAARFFTSMMSAAFEIL